MLAQRPRSAAGCRAALELAEGLLALLDEDVADRLARGGLDLRVGVAELRAEALGQQRAHRGLARAGRADQHRGRAAAFAAGHEITRALR